MLNSLFLTVAQFDSDDEREAAEAKVSLKQKIVSQHTKKSMKNRAQMPRTAGLRTMSEMAAELTKAGLDPSRIQDRAEVLAKAAGAKRKREREEDEERMDVDGEEGESEEDEDAWMDVDGNGAPTKRAKGNSGAIVAKGRQPRSNRQYAGMRDQAVSGPRSLRFVCSCSLCRDSPCSKRQKRSSCGTWGSGSAIIMRRRARPIVRSRPRWYVPYNCSWVVSWLTRFWTLQPKHLFAGKRKSGKTDRR